MFMVDYQTYVETYGGNVVDETDFPRVSMRSGVILDRMTYGHVVEEDGTYGQEIRGEFLPFNEAELNYLTFAFCSLCDVVEQLDEAKANALAGGGGTDGNANVRTRTSGDESITYESKRTAYDDALTDENAKDKLYKDAVFEVCDPWCFRWNPFYAGLERRWN